MRCLTTSTVEGLALATSRRRAPTDLWVSGDVRAKTGRVSRPRLFSENVVCRNWYCGRLRACIGGEALVVFWWRLVAALVALPGGGAYLIGRRTNSLKRGIYKHGEAQFPGGGAYIN
jgi:hypothetical protein